MPGMRILSAIALSLLLALSASAGPGTATAAGGRLSAPTPIAEIGAKFLLPADAAPIPIRPLQTRTWTFGNGERSWEENRVNPLEAWRLRELLGEWECMNRALRLSIARVALPPPPKDLDPRCDDVLPEALDEFFSSRPAPSSPDDLRRWAAAFRGAEPSAGPLPLSPPPFARLARLDRLDFADGSALYVLAFARTPATSHLPQATFAVLLRAHGVPADRLRAFAEQQLFAALRPISSQEASAAASASRRAAAASPGLSGSFRPHPTREAAHRSIAAQKNWWAIDSEDYVLLSDLHDGNAKKMARDLLEKLQDARGIYAKMAPPFAATKDDVSVVRIFDTEEEYVDYVGAAHKNTCGLYVPSRRELIIRPIEGAGGRANKYAEILSTALHEGFHQFLHQGTGNANASVWLNEGHATLFETLSIHHHRVEIPEDKGRMHRLLTVLKANPDAVLPTFLQMDYAQYYAGTHEQVLGHYALGWGFTYFLRRGAPLLRGDPYAAVFPRYFEAMKNGASNDEATRAAFEGIDLARLEADFRAFFSPQGSGNRNKALRTPVR